MNPDDALATILRDLKHRHHEQRIQAIQKLSGFRNRPNVVEAVAQHLANDLNTMVRIAAAQCLGTLGDPSAIPALLAALRPDEELCQTALDSLKMLVPDPKTLHLLRIAQIPPDPEIAREATAQFPPVPWYKLTIPYVQEQTYALQQLAELRDRGNTDDLPRLCVVLEHARMNSTVLRASLEALLAIAHRHPTADLTVVCECLKRRALLTANSEPYRAVLHKLEARYRTSLPVPVSPPILAADLLPIPAKETAAIVPSSRTPQFPRTLELQSPHGDPRRLVRLTLVFGLGVTCLGLSLYGISTSPIIPGVFLHMPSCLQLLLALRGNKQFILTLALAGVSETLWLENRRLKLRRHRGPFRRTHETYVAPDARVKIISLQHWQKDQLGPLHSPHLALLAAGHKPFRFAFGRTPEELERLAETINAYLDSQAASPPPTAEMSGRPEESASRIDTDLETQNNTISEPPEDLTNCQQPAIPEPLCLKKKA